MGIVFRQSIKGSIVIFFGILLGAAFTYLTSIILPKHELGGLRNLLGQGAVIQVLLLAGGANLVNPYLLRYKPEDPKRPVLITITLIVPLVLAIATSAPYFLFKNYVVSRYQPSDRAFLRSFYAWLPLLSLLLSYITLLEYYLSAQLKVAAAIFMREVLLRVLFLILIGLYAYHYISLYFFITGSVLIHIVPVIFLLWISFRTEGFRISVNWGVFNKNEYRDIVHYGWYHLLTTAILNLISYVDALMLGPLSSAGLGDVAVYFNAQFLVGIMYAPYRAMTSAAAPKLAEAYLANSTKEQLHGLFNRAGLNMLIAGTAMWLVIVSNLHNAAAILPKGYNLIIPVVLILSIGRMVDMVTGLNTELIAVSEFYKFNFRLAIVLLIIVIVSDRLIIPRWGIIGAAWVSTSSVTVVNIVRAAFLYLKKGLHPFSKHTLGILFCGGLCYALSFLLPRVSMPVVDALYRSSLLLFVYLLLLLILRSSPDLSHYLHQVRKDKRLF